MQQGKTFKHGEALGISEVSTGVMLFWIPLNTSELQLVLTFVAPYIYSLTESVLRLLFPKWRPLPEEKRLCSAPLSHENGEELLLSPY